MLHSFATAQPLALYSWIHIQDRKPLKDEVKIPQSLEEQAIAQLNHLVGDGEVAMTEHMAELAKARKPVWRGGVPCCCFLFKHFIGAGDSDVVLGWGCNDY